MAYRLGGGELRTATMGDQAYFQRATATSPGVAANWRSPLFDPPAAPGRALVVHGLNSGTRQSAALPTTCRLSRALISRGGSRALILGDLDLQGVFVMIRRRDMGQRRKVELTGEELRELDVEISFLAGLTRRDPGYVEALQLLGDNYTRRGRYREGLEVDEQLARLRPADPMAHYNLACSYALTLQPEAAFAALNLAIDRGFRDFRWLSRDPDLAAFRKHRLYRQLRSRIRAMQVEVR